MVFWCVQALTNATWAFFFQKLKKLKFWTKRGKRVKKDERMKDYVEHNLEDECCDVVERNLNGESSEEDVELNLLEHIEEHNGKRGKRCNHLWPTEESERIKH